MHEMTQAPSSLHMVVTIVDGGKGEKVIKIAKAEHVTLHFVCLGWGTARTEMLDLLGLGETKKDIIMCMLPGPRVEQLLTHLATDMKMKYPGKGIAFALPLSGTSGRMYHALTLQAGAEEKDVREMEHDQHYDLVVTVINQGYTDLIMDAARKVGAPGGTVIHARGIGCEEVEKFLGISIQAEKEIVFMVVPSDRKQAVMQAINQEAGLKTPGRGIVISLPVSHAIGLA